jgi:hypothetical protein
MAGGNREYSKREIFKAAQIVASWKTEDWTVKMASNIDTCIATEEAEKMNAHMPMISYS